MLVNGGNVDGIAQAIVESLEKGGKVIVFGCGGSSSTADHFASELVSHWSGVRLPCISLNVPATLTAICNDFGVEEMFVVQAQAYVRPGDVAIGITTSGRAPAVIRGLEEAGRLGATTIIACGGAHYMPTVDGAVQSDGQSIADIQRDHLDWTHLVTDRVAEMWLDRGNGYVGMLDTACAKG